jgi:single-strand DNA-binding protein
MSNFNQVLIEGNLTRDPELRLTPKGSKVAVFTIASNRYYGSGENRTEEVSFFEVEAWNRLAEVCGEYLTKGRGVRVIGRLKQDRWQTTEGENRSKVKVVSREVEFKPQATRQESDALKSAFDENADENVEDHEGALEGVRQEALVI